MTWEERFSQIRRRIDVRRNELKSLKKPPSPISSFANQQKKINDVDKSISSVEQRIAREKQRFYQTPITKVQTVSSALPIKGRGEEWLEEKTYQVQELQLQAQTIARMCQEYVSGILQQKTDIQQATQRMHESWEQRKVR